MICDVHSDDPYMSLTRMRRSLDWAPITEDFDYEKKQNAFDESDDESEQLTEDFELPINPYDFYFNGKVLPLSYYRKRR